MASGESAFFSGFYNCHESLPNDDEMIFFVISPHILFSSNDQSELFMAT